MDDLLMRSRMNLPVTTGAPAAGRKIPASGERAARETASFSQALENASKQYELSFTKHAAGRVAQREIALSETGLERLDQGLRIAREKGLDDALILMDGCAYIVSAKNGRVITALNGQELSGKVITNIEGAVIL